MHVPITITLPEELVARLRDYKTKTGLPISTFIRKTVQDKLSEVENETE